MKEEKVERYADLILERTVELEKGDNVYLAAKSTDVMPLVDKLREKIIKQGAYPHEHLIYDSQLGRAGMDYTWLKHASDEQLENVSEAKKKELEEMDVYLTISNRDNENELNNIDSSKIAKRKRYNKEIADMRRQLKWGLVRFPTDSLAQKASMSTEDFEDFMYNAININWERLEEKNQKVKEIFDNTDKVRVVSEDTDIEFSIEKRKGTASIGKRNLPDGEVFYAPVTDSVNGEIRFTYPGRKQGNEVRNVWLKLEDGKIVDFSADKNEEFLREQINLDEGSCRFGEFGMGTNWEIDRFTNEMGLDEKMGGTIHFALGNGFDKGLPEDEEPNDSAIHWDIVKDLRKPEGDGGKLIADDEVVQEDGEWQFEI